MTDLAPKPHDASHLALGELLVRNGLATRTQLEDALALQQRATQAGDRIRLGEVLVQLGVIDLATLQALLRLQSHPQGEGAGFELRERGLTPRHDREIGQLALRNGLISQTQLDFALKVRDAVHKLGIDRRLGEVLVREGALSEADVAALLQVQQAIGHEETPALQRLRHAVLASAVTPQDLLFGQVAVHHDFISESQLESAVAAQRHAREHGVAMTLGEVMIAQGLLREVHVRQIARIQEVKQESYFGLSSGVVRQRKASEDALGAILVEQGLVTVDQIGECRRIQQALGRLGMTRLLGQILVDKGHLSPELLHAAIDAQVARRTLHEAARARRHELRQTLGVLVRVVFLVGVAGTASWLFLTRSGVHTWRTWTQRVEATPGPGSGTTPDFPADPGQATANGSAHAGPATAREISVGRLTELVELERNRGEIEDRRRRAAAAEEALSGLALCSFDVVLLPVTGNGLVLDAFGQVPPEKSGAVRLQLSYCGMPVPGGDRRVSPWHGVFTARFELSAGCRIEAPGLYTVVAELDSDETGDAIKRCRAAGSVFVGTETSLVDYAAEVRAELDSLRQELADWLDRSGPDQEPVPYRELENVDRVANRLRRECPIHPWMEAAAPLWEAVRRANGINRDDLSPQDREQGRRAVRELLDRAASRFDEAGTFDPLHTGVLRELQRRLIEARALCAEIDRDRPASEDWLARANQLRRRDAALRELLRQMGRNRELHSFDQAIDCLRDCVERQVSLDPALRALEEVARLLSRLR